MSFTSPAIEPKEQWTVDNMSAFLTKLGFISADEHAVQDLEWYQHIFKVSSIDVNDDSVLLVL